MTKIAIAALALACASALDLNPIDHNINTA